MMRRHWYYVNDCRQKVGLMICTHCNSPITEGEYRYRETDDAYLPQHRNCSEHDQKWQEIDAKREADTKFAAERKEAARQFVEKWGVTDLEEIL